MASNADCAFSFRPTQEVRKPGLHFWHPFPSAQLWIVGRDTIVKTIVILVTVVAICYLFLRLSPVRRSVTVFDHLHENVTNAITATELQAWATNLLALHPTEAYLRASELGTNFPPALREVCPRLGPYVAIHHSGDDHNRCWVTVDWGGGILGHAGFEIGNRNFIHSGELWEEGVYFYAAH